MEAHPLDNPFWHMLCHNLAEFSTGTALAKRCDENVFPVSALADHSDAAFDDFAQLFSKDESAALYEFSPPQEVPGFKEVYRFSPPQLVCNQRIPMPETDIKIIELTPSDVQEMVTLIELTKPGPFFPGLLPLRRFIGIRQEGQLVAMAGERMKLPGYCEISGVCTHPDWRGRGYARLLTLGIADTIWQRGETPFLHVSPDNTTAYRLYETLHFVKRCNMTGIGLVRV